LQAGKIVPAVAFVFMLLLGWVVQTGAGLEKTLLSPGYYRGLLEEADISSLRDYFLETATRDLQSYLLWNESIVYTALVRTAAEDWITEQLDYMIKEYLLFVKGEQEHLLIEIDLSDRIEVFKQELKKELARRSPPQLEIIGVSEERLGEFIEEQLDLPRRLTLVNIAGVEEAGPEVREARAVVSKARVYLRYVPYICLAALAVICALWAGWAGMLKWLGASMVASGVSYLLLWRAAWNALVPAFVNRLAGREGLSLIAEIWPQAGEAALNCTGLILDRISLVYAGIGLCLLLAGLITGRLIFRWDRNVGEVT